MGPSHMENVSPTAGLLSFEHSAREERVGRTERGRRGGERKENIGEGEERRKERGRGEKKKENMANCDLGHNCIPGRPYSNTRTS